MDKNAIKKYAVWARTELIARVAQKANQYGITEGEILPSSADSVHGRLLTRTEKSQRTALIERIKVKGYQQVIEEVAYTWFNRLTAIRFMEVNGYLPSHVRVFTDEDNRFAPQILTEAIHLEMRGLNIDKVYELKQANKTEELYKYLLITQCNALSEVLPGMFQKIEDYTELLLPDNLLREGSVIEQMISLIPEEDWLDQVQIIGWLYQYYNSEPKDLVFANLKKNIKISKENIPAATQLFTPDWIVRYMVENSLGRLWVEGHPNEELKAGWRYYLEEAEQEEAVQVQLASIRQEYANINPEDIKIIDPCMGSGHILVYAFDVLMQIYTASGWSERDAAKSIVERNLYGLDIDDRAGQLAYFAIMMKARKYNRRALAGGAAGLLPNVYAIQESNNISAMALEEFCRGDAKVTAEMNKLLQMMRDAKEYGSILDIKGINFDILFARCDATYDEILLHQQEIREDIIPLVKIAHAMAQKYDVVVTNPPYMNSSGMTDTLLSFLKVHYADSKADLSTVFMEHTLDMLKPNGFMSMINIPVWMMLATFEKLRHKLITENHIVNLLHNGRGIFGSDFGTTAFVFRKGSIPRYKAVYRKLFNQAGEVEKLEKKETRFFDSKGIYVSSIDNFSKIPGAPIAYSASDDFLKAFDYRSIGYYANPVEGIKSGDNERFLRLWFEVPNTKTAYLDEFCISKHKWCYTTKGGAFRKWYGNIEYVIDWSGNGSLLKSTKGTSIYREEYWHQDAITWTYLTAGIVSFRSLQRGMLYNNKGPAVFGNDKNMLTYLCGLINSAVGSYILSFLCSTLTFLPGDIKKIPVIISNQTVCNDLVNENIKLSRDDWDAYETSADFIRHPLV